MLSERRSNILKYIHEHTYQEGFAPTIREIGRATDITSTSVVNYHLQYLIKHGYLLKSPGRARAYALTRRALDFVGEVHPPNDNDTTRLFEEIAHLRNENERLRRQHKKEMNALRREYAHMVNEIHQLRQERTQRPVQLI